MKKILISCLALIMCVSAFSGCGKKEANSDGAITLRVGMPNGEAITAWEIVENFQKDHPEIKLDIDETPWGEFKKKVKLQTTSGNAPALFISDSGHIATMGAMGNALDLSDKVKKDLDVSEYSDTLFAGADSEGKLWGVPHGINSLAVFYNKNLFDEAGLDYPTEDWTFDDMMAMAEKLTKDVNGDGEIDQYGIMYGTNISSGWLPFVLASGGAPLDETRTKSMFNDKNTIEGLKKFIEPRTKKITCDAEWAAANGGTAAFYRGKIGMYIALQSNVTVIETNKPAELNYDAQIMPYGETGKRPCVYVPNLWVINAQATEAEQEAAWTFLKYYLNDESQKILADTLLDGVPVKNSALEYLASKETTPANMRAFYSGLDEFGSTMFENGTFEEWRPKADEIILKMLNGLVDFDKGIDDLHKTVTKVLEQ